MCRRTRQIVAFAIGDRSEVTCRLLWQAIPDAYKRCQTYSDFWEAYANVFPKETHHSVGKESGETNHMQRWNNTLRQSNARYTRNTLSFSKTDFFHKLVTRLFIIRYNLMDESNKHWINGGVAETVEKGTWGQSIAQETLEHTG
jgi:insertion element IS1 protein InsB